MVTSLRAHFSTSRTLWSLLLVLVCAAPMLLVGCDADDDGVPARAQFTGLVFEADTTEVGNYNINVKATDSGKDYYNRCIGTRRSGTTIEVVAAGATVELIPGPYVVTIHNCGATGSPALKTIEGSVQLGETVKFAINRAFVTN